GRARHVGLGSCLYKTLKEARDEAIEYRRMLARGVDPLDTKHGKKLEERRAEARKKTFEQVAREYIAAHENTWRGDGSRKQWTQSLEKYAENRQHSSGRRHRDRRAGRSGPHCARNPRNC